MIITFDEYTEFDVNDKHCRLIAELHLRNNTEANMAWPILAFEENVEPITKIYLSNVNSLLWIPDKLSSAYKIKYDVKKELFIQGNILHNCNVSVHNFRGNRIPWAKPSTIKLHNRYAKHHMVFK